MDKTDKQVMFNNHSDWMERWFGLVATDSLCEIETQQQQQSGKDVKHPTLTAIKTINTRLMT